MSSKSGLFKPALKWLRKTTEEGSEKGVKRVPARKLGLRQEASDAIKKFENIKKDPLGEINSLPGHNHYSAARREAAGKVVARKPGSNVPYSHIRDIQEARDGLNRIRKTLAYELRSPHENITERGREVLEKKFREVNRLLNRTNGFLKSIGYDKTPPYHEFPPGA